MGCLGKPCFLVRLIAWSQSKVPAHAERVICRLAQISVPFSSRLIRSGGFVPVLHPDESEGHAVPPFLAKRLEGMLIFP